MVFVDSWVTIAEGVQDTVAQDFQRAQRVFSALSFEFWISKFILTRDQTQAVLGSDGKLALTGGPAQFTHNLPIGAANSREIPLGVSDPNGRFTQEVWAAIRNWTDIGGLHIFYVPDFDPPSGEGGITLHGSVTKSIQSSLSIRARTWTWSATPGAAAACSEHEIGRAFGLPDVSRGNVLMTGVISSDASDAGTTLSSAELNTIRSSRLLDVVTTWGQRRNAPSATQHGRNRSGNEGQGCRRPDQSSSVAD